MQFLEKLSWIGLYRLALKWTRCAYWIYVPWRFFKRLSRSLYDLSFRSLQISCCLVNAISTKSLKDISRHVSAYFLHIIEGSSATCDRYMFDRSTWLIANEPRNESMLVPGSPWSQDSIHPVAKTNGKTRKIKERRYRRTFSERKATLSWSTINRTCHNSSQRAHEEKYTADLYDCASQALFFLAGHYPFICTTPSTSCNNYIKIIMVYAKHHRSCNSQTNNSHFAPCNLKFRAAIENQRSSQLKINENYVPNLRR